MCGIAGLVSGQPADLGDVFAMTRVQAHRGPDGSGHAFFGRDGGVALQAESPGRDAPAPAVVAFGHRRLAIIDCTEGGHQPMAYGQGRYWITYNGEVYNYRELREELRALGHRFASESDTEVILAAYAQWGTGCFARFNGMWALAIWDALERTLVLSRDRFGVKPLHVATRGGILAFASEIKGILAHWRTRPQAAPVAIHDYLMHGVVNSGDDTFFQGITAFPPGCYAVLRPEQSLELRPVAFWRLDPERESDLPFEEACASFAELFRSAVQLRMRSDVPVGACLSGGLDSSSIVCAMRLQEEQSSIHTFTARFPEPQFDESRWARLAAERARAQAHFSVPTEEGYLSELGDLVWHQEEPFSTASIYAQWLVMKQAREAGIPVLLDGQGADEILGGYKKFYAFHILSLARRGRLVAAGREAASVALRGDRGYLRWREAVRYMPRFLQPKVGTARDWLGEAVQAAGGESSVQLGASGGLRQRQVQDLRRYSVPSLLRYEDRNSMAWSIESRVPFLDYRLAEFALALPVRHKLRDGRTKALLRSGLRGMVPDEILDRRDKMGFVTPQSVWMRGALGARLQDLLASSPGPLRNWIDVDGMLAAWRSAGDRQRQTMEPLLFRAGVLAHWAQRFDLAAP
ncbi:MAG TPA: asparagine synthase (glutamine-hydrolyzing) [Ramlibacter sp.]|uniref:asparagine synthase (glutamine-hydrolyzing) n=1 Tax=Ramlibacter sp. TaxID=1917967 RepID=UPI002ED2AD94